MWTAVAKRWRSREIARAEQTIENQIALIVLLHRSGMDTSSAVTELGQIAKGSTAASSRQRVGGTAQA